MPDLAGQEEPFPEPDNQSKMKRSCENAEHVGELHTCACFEVPLTDSFQDYSRPTLDSISVMNNGADDPNMTEALVLQPLRSTTMRRPFSIFTAARPSE